MSLFARVVCRPEVAPGFALAGLVPVEAEASAPGVERVRTALAQPDAGVILVEDVLYDRLPDDVRRRLGRTPLPMVVPFPGPAWAPPREAAEAYILELLRQVIGYRVRLK
jgi:vacuolar-type H+-ATPase subunit F/Vma7